ncbi:unnamed protein product [Cylicocyclus nassatus]|uniref:SWIM-type domain-containing protein n=1 Tax=Cylicocyclus nassatus TaxID=53992 RepID=A0AA36DJ26_CYLNA|nr:unnamed protein product [Cylicocyclus nassatus]
MSRHSWKVVITVSHIFASMQWLTVMATVMLNVVNAQMMRQCTCNEIEPCTHVTADTTLHCMDQCQRHANEVGLSLTAVQQCFNQVCGPVDSLIRCMKGSVFTQSCAKGNPIRVPKRYIETFKVALFNEMNNVLTKSGVKNQVMAFLKTGKKFASCTLNCGQRTFGECQKRHNCGLSLPSDAILVQRLKQCMLSSGLGTTGVQKICFCLANSGARQLAGVCNRLVMT